MPQRALVAVGPDPSTALPCAPKTKLSQVIDQARDVEVPLLDAETLNELRRNYVVTFGDNPMDNAVVTVAQLRAAPRCRLRFSSVHRLRRRGPVRHTD